MTSAYVVIKWPACYNNCPVDRGARNFDDRISEVPLYCKCEFLLCSSSISDQKLSHVVASTIPKRWVAAAAREVITIDRFRVASTTKWSSKKSQRDCAHSSWQVFARNTAET